MRFYFAYWFLNGLILMLNTVYSSSIKSNILFVVIDDLKPVLGCYGDSKAYTLNIDNLASKSFVFTNTYAQIQALCAPSRNSFLTSRRPNSLHLFDFRGKRGNTTHGVIPRIAIVAILYWRETVGNFTTIPQYFKEHGYHTYFIGKIFHPGISSNFSDDQPYSWSQKPFHPKSIEYENSRLCINNDGSLGQNLICPVAVEYQPLGTLPDIGKKYQSSIEPFFLAVGFHKPHIPFRIPQQFLDFHPLSNVSLPQNRFRLSLLPTVSWNPWIDIRKREDIKKLNIAFPYGPMPDETIKKIIQAYYASVTYTDHLLGRLLSIIDLNNTIVVLTSDHGWSLGEHGEFAKYSNFEEATRVPLIIHVPHMTQKRVHSLVELVDLFPTQVDLADVSKPLKICPRNVTQLDTCTEGTRKTAVFTQYPRPGVYSTWYPDSDKPSLNEIRIMGYSIKTKRYRYCEWVQFNRTNFKPDWFKVHLKKNWLIQTFRNKDL
ncbi:hypothetical protein ABEB36_000475 [Hypothenemus hampei]|uniref:Sulfatase N-terminal domain-containing protein n=1 Tax=Hypothenemus hampei TaxID=57062 RepID=A0ABD1FBE1_HYPHA